MKRNTTHNLTVAAMLSAVAFILMFIEFPIPMLIPSFVKMDFSDLPALLGAFALGPVYGAVISFMKNLLHGDFGYSLKYVGQSVNGIIAEKFPVSAQLGIQAYLLSFPIGVLFGIIAARHRGRAIDYSLVGFSVLGVSVPAFILASLLQYVFAIKLKLLPVALWSSFRHTILPTIALSIGSIAGKTRLMRTLMLEVLTEDYVKTAKAKGLPTWRIIWSHQVRNAIIPMIPSLGMEIVSILMGSFVVEQIFAVPGIGAFFVTSVQSLDYTMTLGLTVFFGVFVVAANFIIDLIYGLVDPRIRIAK